MPEVEARLAIDNPLSDHLAYSTRAGNAVRAEATGGPEPFYFRRFPQDKLSIGCERL